MTEELEKTDELNDEELAKAALEETEDLEQDEPVEKPDPKDAVIGDFRRQVRDLQHTVEELKTAATSQKTPEKSPIEQEADRLGVSVEEVPVDGRLILEQQKFQQKQQQAMSEKEVYDQQKRDYEAARSLQKAAARR